MKRIFATTTTTTTIIIRSRFSRAPAQAAVIHKPNQRR